MNYRRIAPKFASLIVVGALLNAFVAQGVGWLALDDKGRAEVAYAPIGQQAAEVRLVSGFGRLTATGWRMLDPWAAAWWQDSFNEVKRSDKRDAPDYEPWRIPAWCSVWSETARNREQVVQIAAIGGGLTSGPTDVGIGWPFVSFSASLDPRLVGSAPAMDPPPVVRGGIMTDPLRSGPTRVIAWRPVLPGLALGSAFWSAFVALVVVGVPGLRTRWRRRKGRCGMCGYDLSATPTGSCPECGALPALR